MFSNLELRVIATLAYSNQFEFPLTAEEIFRRLVSSQIVTDEGWIGQKQKVTVDRTVVNETLNQLKRNQLVIMSNQFWTLAGNEHCFAHRISATRCTQQKAPLIDQLIRLLNKIDWIEAVFITGSVAVQNALQHDDIDVLIVTKPRRLWLTRLVVLMMSLVVGKRVRVQRQDGAGWCFNLWLETNHLAVPQSKHSLYEAYEVLQAQCVWARPGVAARWLQDNSWVAEFVPNEFIRLSNGLRRKTTKTSDTELQFSVFGVIGDVGNWLAYVLQTSYRWLRYRERPKAFESAFFHSATTKLVLYSQWRRIVNSVYRPNLMRGSVMKLKKRYP